MVNHVRHPPDVKRHARYPARHRLHHRIGQIVLNRRRRKHIRRVIHQRQRHLVVQPPETMAVCPRLPEIRQRRRSRRPSAFSGLLPPSSTTGQNTTRISFAGTHLLSSKSTTNDLCLFSASRLADWQWTGRGRLQNDRQDSVVPQRYALVARWRPTDIVAANVC